MKERNIDRKRAMKKARDKVLRQKELHKNISTFLVKWLLRTTRDPYEEYSRMLSYGFKGFDYMRSKELIGHFEHAYTVARDKEYQEELLSKLAGSYGKRIHKCVPLYQGTPREMLEDITLDSESLMSRLMELAFDLDVVE